MRVNSAGTVIAQSEFEVAVPVPYGTRIRGKATSAAAIDTDAELLGFLWDVTVFDLTSGVYTIDTGGDDDNAGLIIRDGNVRTGTLDVVVDARAMRADITN